MLLPEAHFRAFPLARRVQKVTIRNTAIRRVAIVSILHVAIVVVVSAVHLNTPRLP